MRRLHRADRRRSGALVHPPRVAGAGRRDHHARRPRHRRPAASDPAGVDRRAGAGVRLLPERPDPHRQGAARQDAESHRRADSRGHEGRALPLHDVLPDQRGGEARCQEARMKTRREFIKTSGFLIASVSAISLEDVGAHFSAPAQVAGPYPDVDFRQLDSWIVIRGDNTATFFVGKTDLGQGTGTAFRQIMSDELDIAFENTTCVMGRTDITVDQGGSGGSDALQTDGYPMRRVAAEARRVLLEMASNHFGVPVTSLRVSDGVVTTNIGDTADRGITYGELIGGKKFNVTLTGRNIDATTGQAPLKAVQAMKNVGKSPRRDDIPAKVDGTQRWAVDMKAPGMLHARNVRPPMVGATLKAIDESSLKSVPGVVKVISRGNYLAVVCEREEQALRAARQLKVEWTPPQAAPFPASENLFTYMRSATPSSTGKPVVVGDVAAALAAAPTKLEAHYEVPFQGHTAFGPAHAMADPSNGQLTIYSNDMK